jgi:hypothetical protein
MLLSVLRSKAAGPATATTFVQDASGMSAGSDGFTTATFVSPPTAGNLLILSLAMDKSTAAATPAGWSAVVNSVQASVSLFMAWKVSDGTETTVTVNHPINTSGNMLHIREESSATAGVWSLVASASTMSDNTAVLSQSTGVTGAISNAGLGVAIAGIDSSSNVTTVAWTSSYTARYTGTGGGTRGGLFVADRQVAVGPGQTSTFSYTGTADQVSAAVAVFAKVPTGLTAVVVTRPTTWGVKQAVGPTRSTLWNDRVAVTPTRPTTWNVASALTSVAVARATSWTTRAQISTTRATSWTDRKAVNIVRSTIWQTLSTGTVTTTPGMRMRAYLPIGADQGPLPSPQSVTTSFVLNDVGALTFDYSLTATRASLLGQPLEIAVEVSPDNGVTWFEPANSRFVYTADGRDPLDPADKWSVEAKSYVWRLSKARVLPNGLLNNAGQRAFLSATPGVILKTLFNEAQNRGAMSGITHASFTTANDSNGAGWANILTIYYDPGMDYLTVLQNLADQGMVDYSMQGRDLRVYNPNTALAVDRTVSSTQTVLRAGRDLTDAPFRRTWEGLADYVLFLGDVGATYEYTNPAAVTPWGRQETFVSNGSVTDPGTMATLAQAELSQNNDARIEYTRSLDFTRAAQMPFRDYGVGDYVYSAVDGTGVAKLRVRQLTMTRDNLGRVAGNVVLNDRFLEADIRARRRVEGITNGAQGTPGTVPNGPSVTGKDTLAPAQVTGLAGTSSAYMGPGGFPQAQVTLSWTPVTTNSDGTPADDVDHYELFRRVFGQPAGSARQFATTTDSSVDLSPYAVGSSWVFSVTAVDTSGNRGLKSADTSVGMAQDTTPPQAPSTPIMTAYLGVISVYWDGNPASGSWPGDMDHVEVHTSTVNNFTPTTATLSDVLYGEGASIVTGTPYGIPLFAKFVAVDKTPLKSAASAQSSATASRLVGSDLNPDAITYEQIGFKDPGNVLLDGSFESATYQAAVAARSSTAWSFTTTDHYHGNWSATINAAVLPSTWRYLYLMADGPDNQQIRAGEKLFARMAYKATSGATGDVQLVAQWNMQDGSISYGTVTSVLKNGTWQQTAAQLTAPAGVATFRAYVQLTSAATTGTYSVDAVEVRRTVGTSIIEDAAIGNAQINNLAVNSAKISDLDAGKLTAGTMTADVLVAGRLMTASAGNRLEMSGTGLRLFQGATATVWLNPGPGQLRIYNTTDASHTSTGHGIQMGDDNGANVILDNNEIMARFNGGYATLGLNMSGGGFLMGGLPGGVVLGTDVIPRTDDHHAIIRSSVEIQNTNNTADYADDWAPLMVGWRGSTHLYMKPDAIGASTGSGAGDLYLNPTFADGTIHFNNVWLGANSIAIRRIGAAQGGVISTEASAALQFFNSQINARDASIVGNRSLGASAFNTLSQTAAKHMIGDIENPLGVVRAVKSRRWQFRDEINPENQWHYGPMLEDLPEELHTMIGETQKGYDVGSVLGLLWAAFRQHLDECHAES